MTWNVETWAEENFGDCELGDVRRTRRIVRLANLTLQNPTSSLPGQTVNWAGLKAAYRLFHRKEATVESIGSAHWARSRSAAQGETLVICDTTEIDFGSQRKIKGAGPTGNGSGKGFLLHNAMFMDERTRTIIGLGAQVIHTRPLTPLKDNNARKLKRDRESEVWGKAVDIIGPAADGVSYTVVCDRGADNFEFFVHLLRNGHGWILRAKSLNRAILDCRGERMSLAQAIQGFQRRGAYELTIAANANSPARVATVEVSSGRIKLPQPRNKSPYVRQYAPMAIDTHVVAAIETNPPAGVTPVSWVIYTSRPATTFDACWKCLDVYEARWRIEEYHKALKSGCLVESHQLRDAEALAPLVAYLSVVAVALLQLRTHANANPDEKAAKSIPKNWLVMLRAVANLKTIKDLTIKQFYRRVAMLGGFLGRASDGQPGWQVLWRGWHQLHMFVRGAEALERAKRCG